MRCISERTSIRFRILFHSFLFILIITVKTNSASHVVSSVQNRDMFVLVDSDVDEQELGFVSKKLKKIYKKREARKKLHTTSVSQTRKGNTIRIDSEANKMIPNNAKFELKEQKRKRALEASSMKNKRQRMGLDSETRIDSDCNLSDMRSEINANGIAVEQINCEHCTRRHNENFITTGFVGNEQIDNEVAVISDSSFRTCFSKYPKTDIYKSINNDTINDSIRPIDSFNSSVSGHEKALPQMRKCCIITAPGAFNHDAQIQKDVLVIKSSCLTDCASCAAYSLPVLSETDSREMTDYIALDCEFVGVGPKKQSALGRCSIVDYRGVVLFDRFVQPTEPVTDYRTPWSGLRHRNLQFGIPFEAAQEQIAVIIKEKIVVGHAVYNDFRVMGLPHPMHNIRDTASCKLLREMANLPGGSCALRKLTKALLGRTIQKGEHCSVTDARACMDLFRMVRSSWEPILKAKFKQRETRFTQGDMLTEKQPGLNNYFDDEYWPSGMFEDSY